jgi:hypothetical protein
VVPLEPVEAGAQDLHRLLGRQLAHDHALEAAFEGGVAADPAIVLLVGGRADDAEVASDQRRLEHVGGVHRHA